MSKTLPSRPHLDPLRDQAKALLSDYRKGDAEAVARFVAHLPGLKDKAVALHDAQSVVAREYGFTSWPKLVSHIEEVRAQEGITPEIEAQFIEAILTDFHSRTRRLLELYPGLPRFSPVCALVSAETDLVAQVSPTEKLGPRDLTPIEYVAYSRMHQIRPERFETQEECARILLERGADPNTFLLWQGEGKIPVLYGAASESGHLGIVNLLLEHGANPNDGESVYHTAEKGRLDILEALAAHGAEFGPPDESLGFLVYFREFYANTPEMLAGAQWLLEHGANPNIVRTELRETPLHAACRYGRKPDLIELLLNHEADPTMGDRDGNTAYQVALSVANETAIRLLEARGVHEEPRPETAFLAACTVNDQAAIRGADPGLTERLLPEMAEMMMIFTQTGRTEGILGLLAAGYPIGRKHVATPLHYACIEGQAEAVRVLIAQGAPLDIRDDDHNSPPIGWACFGSFFRGNAPGPYAEIVRQLVAAGSSLQDAQDQLDPMTATNLPPEVAQALRDAVAIRS